MRWDERRKRRLYFLLILMCLGFIWGNSALPGDVSGELSKGVLAKLFGIFGRFGEKAEFVVRKCAHFSEFALLGLFALGFVTQWRNSGGTRILLAMFLSLAAACVDETIQIYTPGRYSSLLDVWVDTAGAFCGCLVLLIIAWVRLRIKSRTSGKTDV